MLAFFLFREELPPLGKLSTAPPPDKLRCPLVCEKAFVETSALLRLLNPARIFALPSPKQLGRYGVTLASISVLHKCSWGSQGEAVSGAQLGVSSYVPPAQPLPRNWYAVHTRARHEKVVAAQLHARGLETYLPLVSEIHRWSDRRKRVQVPLFSGYAFIHTCESAATLTAVAQIKSVVRIVGAQPSGTPIPEAQIEAVRLLLSHNIPCVNYPFLKVGRRVRIHGGALEGLEGTLLAVQGTTALVVSIELIQRALAVRIEGYDVEVI